MSIELSDQSGSPFTELNLSERREAARAIHRAEHLDSARGMASRMADEARAIEASMAARGVTDPTARREAAEAVAAAVSSTDRLDAEVQDYRSLLHGDNRSTRAMGQYVTLLRNARAGDVDAIASVRTAQTELAEARAENAAVDQYGRFVLRDDNGLAINVTNTPGEALSIARKRGTEGTVIHDRDSAEAAPVGVVRRGDDGAVMEGYDPAFEAAANAELGEHGRRRSTPGVFTRFESEREPEQTIVGFEERTGQRNELTPTLPAAESEQESELERVARRQRAIAYPEGFERRYLVVGDRVVDARQHERVLMVDKTSRLEATRDFDSETVRLMVETAKARGWNEVTVRGSAEFRQAVWTAAITQGIEAKGHEPTATEKAWADRQREAATVKIEASKSAASAFEAARTPEDRKVAAEKHPELVKAFALDAAVTSFAKRIQNQDGREAFTARIRQHITDDLHAGRPIAEIRVRQSMNDELRRQQQERIPERDR